MKMMKKVLALALAGAMALCVLTGCGGGGGGSSSSTTKALVDELNKQGTITFEKAAQAVTAKEIQQMADHANTHLAQGHSLKNSVLYSVEDELRALLKDNPSYQAVYVICSIITNSDKLTVEQMAEKTMENLLKTTVDRNNAITREYKSKGQFDLTEGATYTVNTVTFNTNAGTCTVVVMGRKA